MAKKKWYVVLKGKKPGIYTLWEDAKEQVSGFPAAVFRGFESENAALKAWQEQWFPALPKQSEAYQGRAAAPASGKQAYPSGPFLVVDAACSGVPGPTEYQGFLMPEKKQLFCIQVGWATNNIGEFLAIVHAMAWLKKQNSSVPVYSDSATAISWIRKKELKTNLPRNEKTKNAWNLLDRALEWLKSNSFSGPLRKWETSRWGENPADFGRK